jgi:hypothetical protein
VGRQAGRQAGRQVVGQSVCQLVDWLVGQSGQSVSQSVSLSVCQYDIKSLYTSVRHLYCNKSHRFHMFDIPLIFTIRNLLHLAHCVFSDVIFISYWYSILYRKEPLHYASKVSISLVSVLQPVEVALCWLE